jgi:predicted ATPase
MPTKKRDYLKNIKVKGFKSIREMDLELKPLNVLIGANGSGKSNFLSLFKMIHDMFTEGFEDYVRGNGGPEKLLYFGLKHSDCMSVQLSFEDKLGKGYVFNLKPTKDMLFWFAEEKIIKNSAKKLRINQAKLTIPDLGPFSVAKKLPENQKEFQSTAKELIQSFSSWQYFHFEDTSYSAKLKQAQYIDDMRILYSDASNLAPVLYWLKNNSPYSYKMIVETVKLIAPFFVDFILEPQKENNEYIFWRWRHKNSDRDWFPNQMPDGLMRFISLITLFNLPQLPSMVLLDEPELGLHPQAISLLTETIQAFSGRTQIIVATQSPTFVDYFKPEDIIVVNKEGNESTFKRQNSDDLKDWLEDYSLGELWEKNVIGGNP